MVKKENVRLKVVLFEGYYCVICPKGWYAPGWHHVESYRREHGLYMYPYMSNRDWSRGLSITLDFARETLWDDLDTVAYYEFLRGRDIYCGETFDSLMDEATKIWPLKAAQEWAYGFNDYLEGARPIDIWRNGDREEVLKALDIERA